MSLCCALPRAFIETVSGEVTVLRDEGSRAGVSRSSSRVVPVAANGFVDKGDAPLGIEPVDNIGCSLQDGGQLLFGPGESPLSCEIWRIVRRSLIPTTKERLDRDQAANQGENPVGLAPAEARPGPRNCNSPLNRC